MRKCKRPSKGLNNAVSSKFLSQKDILLYFLHLFKII